MRSKEESMLELFFNQPTKEWHFEEIVKKAKMARSKVDSWLKKFKEEKLIKKIKEKGKMPYYLGNYEEPAYQHKKKLFALKKLYESGFLNHLSSLKKVKAVIIFGSYARFDWYQDSDIDLFIYGDAQGLKLAEYELKLKRNIEVFLCEDKQKLKQYGEGLIKNIIKGNLIKGTMDFVKVKANA